MKMSNISQMGLELKKNVIKTPLTLTLIPTHKCTAACKGCCFASTPKIKHIMSYEQMVKHINEALEYFPSLLNVVITGGECFLLGEKLDEIISYITKKGLKSRVVTNAYWAISYENAYKRLISLKEKGLTEINFSTGDNHQEFVNLTNIINAIKVAIDLGFTPLYVNIEGEKESIFTERKLKEHSELKELICTKKLYVTTGKWISMNNKEKVFFSSKNNFCIDEDDKCDNIFKSITINPYSQLLACCGLTVEYNKYLKLGNLQEHSLEKLYDKQFNDIFKIWLYTHGPKYIYEKIMEENQQVPTYLSHHCAYCMELIKEKNIKSIKQIIHKYIPSIIYQIKMLSEYEKY